MFLATVRMSASITNQRKWVKPMAKYIGFHHGALCDKYEKQANDQGYTLGEDADLFQKLGFGLTINYIHGTLTDSAYDKALQRLQKQMVKAVKPLEKGVCKTE